VSDNWLDQVITDFFDGLPAEEEAMRLNE